MDYTHLTQEERYHISTLLREGFSKRYISWSDPRQYRGQKIPLNS